MKISVERRPLARAAIAFAALALVGGCGGGGGGGNDAAGSPSSVLTSVGPLAGAPGTQSPNVLAVSVGKAGKVNLPLASVTLCTPGSAAACVTVERVLVDTGSVGVRIAASALAALALPPETDTAGDAVGECAQFADGYMWGAVRIADVTIAGEQAHALPVQVVGDPQLPLTPARCASTGRSKDPVTTMGINGILGVGSFRHDCGAGCAQSTVAGVYYACAASGCRSATRPLAQQVANPVTLFAANNNGVIVDLPAVPANGAAEVNGSLVFGIGTQQNNTLRAASVFALSTLTGGLLTFYNGDVLDHSILDTGSNALFFSDASLPPCGGGAALGFYCASSPRSLSAVIQGVNGINASVAFSVDSAEALLATGANAFSNLGAPAWSGLTFDWGLPFFFGRRVYVAIEDAPVPGADKGPFVAF